MELLSWNREDLRYARRQRFGEMMFVWVAIGTGILCYWLNIMCQYDLETEKREGRIRYFWRLDKQRGMTMVLSLMMSIGLTWLFDQYHYGPLKVVRYLLLLALLYPIARQDAREKVIPNRWLFYILVCRGILFAAELICFPGMWIENIKFILIGGIASGMIFFIAYVVSRHAIGMGDVKLFAVIGLCLGFKTTYLVMIVSLILSAFYGGSMVLCRKKSMKDEMAFGPFVTAGTLIVLLLGA